MRIAGNDFNRSELAGAFGDLGTLYHAQPRGWLKL
jgi:hypothetical protein